MEGFTLSLALLDYVPVAAYSTTTMDCAFSIFSSISETTTFFASRFLDMMFSSFPKGFGKEKPLRWAQGRITVFTEKISTHTSAGEF